MSIPEGTILKSRYKIMEKIGGGGYGQVYLAEDTLKESLWAVKEMNVEGLSEKDREDIREQFWFEAKILVKLSHPQLPEIEDFFEDNGKYYIVMEYIKGKDLFDIIKLSSKPFPVKEVTQWVIKICKVLEYLHNQKPHAVIFRDLKPENIMLSDSGEIKLIDFGISKLFDVNRHTRSYAKAASPYFSSPEQYGGQTTDRRSDIFSLGATMYYLYTGNFPVDAIERAINEIPMTPPGRFNREIPEKLDNIILKAMELNKENRYQTVEELTEDLLVSITEKETETGKICPKCERENPNMSRFCGRCGISLTPEEPKITTELKTVMTKEPEIITEPEKKTFMEEEAKIIDNLEKRTVMTEESEIPGNPEKKKYEIQEKNAIYSGNQFIFIDASDEKPFKILKKTRQSAEEYTEQVITRPAVISRYHYSVKGIEPFTDDQYISLIPLKQFSIIPDKKIYLSCEEIKLFSFSPGLNNEKLNILLYRRDSKDIYYEDTIELDEEGISYKVLPSLNTGDYLLKIIENNGNILDELVLNIYEKLPPLLDVELKYYRFDKNIEEGNSITVDLFISINGIPFNGLLKLLLLCNNILISSLRPDIEKGRFTFKFNTDNNTGPFILKGEGEGTFHLTLPLKEREEKAINIGNSFEISLKKLPEKTERGIFYKKIEKDQKLIDFQSFESDTGRVKVLHDLNFMQIVVINPVNGESKIYDFNNILKDSILEFPVFIPYSLIHAGLWQNYPYETFGIIISPLKISASMDIPHKAKPGEEVEVVIETEETSHCMFIVTDSEIKHSPITGKLTYDLYYNIMENTEFLKENFIEKPLDKFEKGENFIKKPFGDIEKSERRDYIDKYDILPLITDREGEIIYLELLTVDKIAKKMVKIPDRSGTWHVYSYILKDLDYVKLHKSLTVEENLFIEFDLPKIMNKGDNITGKVYFESPGESTLLISTPTDYFEGTVSGTGSTDFELFHPGEVTGKLSTGDKHSSITSRIYPGGTENFIYSDIILLKKGDIIEGQSLTVYPGYEFTRECMDSIHKFQIESSEVLSSKLASLAIKYKFISKGDMTGDPDVLIKEINDKLETLTVFLKNGLFSLWEESQPSIDLSIKVMSNMRFFLHLPFPLAHRLIENCTSILLNKGIRKHSLSELNSRFMPLSSKTENPILTCIYGPQTVRGQMAELVKILAIKDGDMYYWKGEDFWGGNMEATCHALRVMYRQEENYFSMGLKFILKSLRNKTLNSTSDTLALIELLSEINLHGSNKCMINEEAVTLNNTITVHGRVEAMENILIVKKDREETINYLEKTKRFSLSIDIMPEKAVIGEVISITIKPHLKTLCPVAKIFLPGNIDLLEITPGIQFIALPVKREKLEIKALAVRKGKGKIHVIIEDFYKPEYSGSGESIDIITGEE